MEEGLIGVGMDSWKEVALITGFASIKELEAHWWGQGRILSSVHCETTIFAFTSLCFSFGRAYSQRPRCPHSQIVRETPLRYNHPVSLSGVQDCCWRSMSSRMKGWWWDMLEMWQRISERRRIDGPSESPFLSRAWWCVHWAALSGGHWSSSCSLYGYLLHLWPQTWPQLYAVS